MKYCPICENESVISGTEENGKMLHHVCITDGCTFDIYESVLTKEIYSA